MTRRIYQSGDCRVDPVARELWRRDRLVELPPQVFDCLAYLIERSDRAVGRDELVAAVWGRTEVSDTLLGQTVLRIRRELGDDGKEQRIVRTIPRFGYRWVAPLVTIGGGEAVPLADPVAATEEGMESPISDLVRAATESTLASDRRWPTMGRRIGLAMGAAAVVGVAIVLIHRHDERRSTASATIASTDAAITVAVIPAEVDAGNDWSWLRFGVMDIVASHLRASGVPTVPSENVIALLATPASQRSGSLRATAGFGWLVSPRTSRSGNGWRVHLDADDGAGQQRAVEATAADAADAARLAADRLLIALGRTAPDGNTDNDAAPHAELIRRVDAAVLADDPATARRLIERASAAAQTSPELRLRLAKIDFRGGRLDAAQTRLLGLLDEASADTAPVQRAAVLNGLGAVAIRKDQPVDAERYFAEAVGLLVAKPEPAQLGVAYIGRAGAEKEQGRFDEASADYSRARIALKQANDTLALLRVAANEGFLDLEQGRPAQALVQLASAGQGFERWGALNEAIYASIGQIGCHLALLDPARAMDAADAAAPLAARIDNQDTRDSLTIARARALAANGRLREARDALGRLRDRGVDASTEAAADIPLAQLELDAGDLPVAATLATAAVNALVHRSDAQQRARAWLIRTRAALRAPDAPAMRQQVTGFSVWATQAVDPRVALFAQLAQAEYAWRFGDGREWRAQFDRARTLAEQRAVPADLAMVAAAYADALMAEGDLPSAAVEVGRLSRWSERDFASAVMEARLYAALGRDEARQAALARARTLAGERALPPDTQAISISSHEASTR